MTVRIELYNTRDREPGMGLFDLCRTFKKITALGFNTKSGYDPLTNYFSGWVEFETEVEAVEFKLKYL